MMYDKKKIGFLFKIIVPVVMLVMALLFAPIMFGINDAGQRTVVQYPSGTLFVKFSPGWYIQAFGKTTEYNDVITFDFDRTTSEGGRATLDQKGISVRYQDGGMGSVYGKARFSLPTDEMTMVTLHKAFRSNNGVANKLIKSVTEESMNLSAGLMTSEDAYATKRAIFTELAKSQISNGKFKTVLETITTKDEATGKTVWKQVPVIAEKDGIRIHVDSDLKTYGIGLIGFQLNDPGFEDTTRTQIAEKRKATMAIITAKANAEKAKQEAITAEEDGKRDVMKAKYLEEVEKVRAVVIADREKEVAIVKAEKLVEVAKQEKLQALVVADRRVEVAAKAKLEAEQKKLAANEYKLEQIARGEGDGAYKRLVMQADGALEQKLHTYETVMERFAIEFGKQKWVPEVQMGGTGDGAANEAGNLISLLTATTLKQLGLDMKMEVEIPAHYHSAKK